MNPISTDSIIKEAKSYLVLNSNPIKAYSRRNTLIIVGQIKGRVGLNKYKNLLTTWQWEQLQKFKDPAIFNLPVELGTWSFVDLSIKKEKAYTPTQLRASDYSLARDRVGSVYNQLKADFPTEIIFQNCSKSQILGSIVGLGVANYNYYFSDKNDNSEIKLEKSSTKKVKTFSTKKKAKSEIYLSFISCKVESKDIQKAKTLYESINLARHLVNLPANILGPNKFVDIAKKIVGRGSVIKVLGPDFLERNGYGLISGVGRGAVEGPYIVHIKYRKGPNNQKPIALIGKGITFDTGGLDLKPANFMRTMKKDMGGSASVLAVANYVISSKTAVNCDFYLGIAENSVSEKSFRPGDILVSKKGLSVEIHNTDAEGRLVLADVMTLATSQKEKPSTMIDVATLTGAVKLGLGSYLPGIFSNDEKLVAELMSEANKVGEPLWPLPLDPQLDFTLETNVADLVNSSDGYGGAISAALFLERFSEGINWAHFDIYAWTDSPRGALTEKGGTGQMVQTLVNYLEGN